MTIMQIQSNEVTLTARKCIEIECFIQFNGR